MKQFLILIVLVYANSLLQAQTTYTFTGNGNWSNAANWQDNQNPPVAILPNTTINISPAASGQCIVDIAVVIPATCTLNVLPGAQMNVMGNLTILNTPLNRGVLLTRAIFIDSTVVHPYDTIQRNNYYYDAEKRAVKIEQVYMNRDNGDTSGYNSDSFYYYGNDTLAYRKITKKFSFNPPSISADTFDYTYHSSGKRWMDSMHNEQKIYVNKCVYVGDSLRVSGVYNSNTGYSETKDWKIYQQWHDGIMISQKDTVISMREGYVTKQYSETLVNSYYPDKPNPFYVPGSASRKDFFSQLLGIYTDNVPAKLIKQQTGSYKVSFNNLPFDNYASKKTYEYVFRDDGYPSVAWEKFEDFAALYQINYKIIFVYNQ